MSGAHSFLAFSGAPYWGRCSLWARMAAMYPQPETQESREGTAMHWIVETTLRGVPPTPVAPNGVVITRDMLEAAQVAIDNISGTVKSFEAFGPITWGVETRIEARRIHPTHCGGTPDVWLYCPAAKTLIDWQLKFGHEEVNEYENLQEIATLSGLADHLGLTGLDEQTTRCQIRIVQPRCYTARGSVRTWHFTLSDLRAYWNKLEHKGREAIENPQATTGPQCLHCAGRHVCTSARQAAGAAIEYSSNPTPEPLTPDALSFELDVLERAAEAIEARLTGLQEQAKGMIRAGARVPGYGLEPTSSRLDWREDMSPAAIRALGAMYGVDIEKRDEFITPTQAKKAGKIDEAVIMAYAAKRNTGLKLVKQAPEDIKRIISSME